MLTSSPTLSPSGNQYLKEPTRSRANTSSPRPRPIKRPQQDSPRFRSSSPTTLPHRASVSPTGLPRPRTADASTQYTPPDWPPTSSRSSVHGFPHQSLAPSVDAPFAAVAQPGTPNHQQPAVIPANPKLATPLPPEPDKPRLRVTPQTSLYNVPTAVRRQHTAISSETPPESPAVAKRTRPQKPDAKILPKDYWRCDAKVLAAIIADMLMELIRFNDEIPLGSGHLTRFHSRAPPGISVHDYLARLTYHATLSPPILLSMVYYIDKLCALYTSFTINSLTVHRFLITAGTVASKGLSDSFWTNNTYARVGGVNIKELALLEIELLTRLQWRIVPSPEALLDYYKNLVSRSASYVIEGEEADKDDEEVEGSGDGVASQTTGQDIMDTSNSSSSDEGG